MSEEKLYVVKNNDGEYWDFNDLGGFWKLNSGSRTVTVSEDDAKKTAKEHGGHVVTLIEEPEEVKNADFSKDFYGGLIKI